MNIRSHEESEVHTQEDLSAGISSIVLEPHGLLLDDESVFFDIDMTLKLLGKSFFVSD